MLEFGRFGTAMASNESNELAHTSLKEELDVLTAIYGEDLKIHSPKTEDGCVSANTGMRCDGREVPLMLPLVLDVTINQEMSVHFHLSGTQDIIFCNNLFDGIFAEQN